MLVEGDRAVREMLKAALSTDAYTFVEANKGAEALGLFRKGQFDLVIVDLALGATRWLPWTSLTVIANCRSSEADADQRHW